MTYEISYAIKSFEGAYEAGVLADHLSAGDVERMILDLPSTWKKDNVALLVRDERARVLSTVVFTYVDEDDVATVIVFKDDKVAYPKTGDEKFDFRSHNIYDSRTPREYLYYADTMTTIDFRKNIYRPYFFEVLDKISNPRIADEFLSMLNAATTQEAEEASKKLRILWDSMKNAKYSKPREIEINIADVMNDYLNLFHGISTVAGFSTSLMTMHLGYAIFGLENKNASSDKLRVQLVDRYKQHMSLVEFVYLYWSTTAFDNLPGFVDDASVMALKEKAETDKKKFFLDQ